MGNDGDEGFSMAGRASYFQSECMCIVGMVIRSGTHFVLCASL